METPAASAKILDGKAVAARVRGDLARQVAELTSRGVQPGLAVVLVGEDPASQIYVRNKTKACAEAGIRTFDHRLPATDDRRQSCCSSSRGSTPIRRSTGS